MSSSSSRSNNNNNSDTSSTSTTPPTFRPKSFDIKKHKFEETEDERLKRFDDLMKAIQESDNAAATDGTDTTNSSQQATSSSSTATATSTASADTKAKNRLSLRPAQALRIPTSYNKRHTISLSTSSIAELAKTLDKEGKRVLKMGELNRRSDILKKWKVKFVVAREDKFLWYGSLRAFEMGSKPEGSMVYKQALVDREDPSEVGGAENVFSFNSRGKACFIQCKSAEEREEWVNALKKIVREFS